MSTCIQERSTRGLAGKKRDPQVWKAIQCCSLEFRQLSVRGPDYVQVDAQGTLGWWHEPMEEHGQLPASHWAFPPSFLISLCPGRAGFLFTRLCHGTLSVSGCPENLGDTL